MNENVIAILVWLAILEIVCVSFGCRYPGRTLRRTSSIIILSILAWYGALLSRSTVDVRILWLCILTVFSKRVYSACAQAKERPRPDYMGDLVFYAGFLIVLASRALAPEAIGLQRPMDMALLQYFTRSGIFPPQDPWAAGYNLNYYYLGYYSFGLLNRLASVPPSIGYNLAIATVAGLSLEVSYGIFRAITGSRRFALLGMLFLIGIPTFGAIKFAAVDGEPLALAIWHSRGLAFVNEYPFCSILLSQLHPHLMALPIGLTLLYLLGTEYGGKGGWHTELLSSVTFAVLCMTNLWDGIAYGLLIMLCFIYELFGITTGARSSSGARAFQGLFFRLGFSGVLLTPFLLSIRGNIRGNVGWAEPGEVLAVRPVALHFGSYLILILSAFFISRLRFGHAARVNLLITLPAVLLLTVLWIFSHGSTQPLVFLMFVLAMGLFLSRTSPKEWAFIDILASAGILILAFANIIVIYDRMNTVYKLMLPAWIWIGIASLVRVNERLAIFTKLERSAVGIAVGLSVLVYVTCAVQYAGYVTEKGPRPTLDAVKFMANRADGDYDIISWINGHVRDSPVILEAYDREFGRGGRMSAYTGLPSVLGWKEHAAQKGLSDLEVYTRMRDIDAIYQAPQFQDVSRLIEKYGIQFIVLGALERSRYGIENESIFDRDPSRFKVVFRHGDATLYSVRRNQN